MSNTDRGSYDRLDSDYPSSYYIHEDRGLTALKPKCNFAASDIEDTCMGLSGHIRKNWSDGKGQ